jgi:RimJ/RimL family protein N-acetyltransferase
VRQQQSADRLMLQYFGDAAEKAKHLRLLVKDDLKKIEWLAPRDDDSPYKKLFHDAALRNEKAIRWEQSNAPFFPSNLKSLQPDNFAVIDTETQRNFDSMAHLELDPIGVFALHEDGGYRWASIGINQSHQGKGLGTTAFGEALELAFSDPKARHFAAKDIGNPASDRIQRNFGFKSLSEMSFFVRMISLITGTKFDDYRLLTRKAWEASKAKQNFQQKEDLLEQLKKAFQEKLEA